MAKERHSHPDGYTGKRTKGIRMGTLWWNKTHMEGDVTFFVEFDQLDEMDRIDALDDWIGMLKREDRVQSSLTFDDLIAAIEEVSCMRVAAGKKVKAPAKKTAKKVKK